MLSNEDWNELAEWEPMLFLRLDKAPMSDKDAVIVTYLDPGKYTAVVRGAAGEEWGAGGVCRLVGTRGIANAW